MQTNSRNHYSAPLRIGIVGATGAVGVEMVKCLERRRFRTGELRLLASPRSAGKTLSFNGKPVTLAALTPDSLAGLDLVLFSASSKVAAEYAPQVVRHGGVVIDNSSAFRMDPSVPLVVPEINAAAALTHRGIVANPNCSAIIAITPLWPLHRRYGLKRLIVSTYQAASGAGAAAMQELIDSTRAYLDGVPFAPAVLPHPYAFNVFSHNSAVDPESGYNGEEMKVAAETRKIFGAPELRVSATCVRVPVLRAHAISVNAEFETPLDLTEVRAILARAPGVRVVDDPKANHFPMPQDASEIDDILVGRIRPDLSDPSGRTLWLFSAGDQLLKGAALNAVQIAECLAREGALRPTELTS